VFFFPHGLFVIFLFFVRSDGGEGDQEQTFFICFRRERAVRLLLLLQLRLQRVRVGLPPVEVVLQELCQFLNFHCIFFLFIS